MHEIRIVNTAGFHWHAECSCGWRSRECFYERDAKDEAKEHIADG